MKINWTYILLYILLAIGISIPVHLGYFDEMYAHFTKGWIIANNSYLLAGLGPFIAGLLLLVLHKSVSNKITIWGSNKAKNISIVFLPVIAFSIVGFENNRQINPHYFGFVYALVNVLYAFLEEFGWRRYLQNALEGFNKHGKYLLIGLVWWIWHARFNTSFDLYGFPFICLGGGYLLGKLADDIKSILPVVMMHSLIILLTNSGAITPRKLLGAGLVIVGWIVIERFTTTKGE